jgi:hypothetical protein
VNKIRKSNIKSIINSIFIVFLFPFIIFAEINHEILSSTGIMAKESLLKSMFLVLPDSLNQRVLTSLSNSSYEILSFDGIPAYSLFDGKYHFDFLKNIDLKNSYSILDSARLSVNKLTDTSENKILLFSSNFNGLLSTNFYKQKKHLYYKIRTDFASSGGYYYSGKTEENDIDLIFLENSSFQNLGLNGSFGFFNKNSDISINLIYNKSKLYVPIRLMDTSKLSQHFNVYDSFYGYLKFDNFFSEKLHIFGNFFLRQMVRNYGASFDTVYIPIKLYNSKLEIDEYNYGANLFVDFNTFGLINPTRASAEYTQNIFLFSNEGNLDRVRTESENLGIKLHQKILYTDALYSIFSIGLKSRAILYSDFEVLPANKSTFEFKGVLNYSTRKSVFEFLVCKFSVFPFAAGYFTLQPSQIGNLDLKSENWLEFQFAFEEKFENNFSLELKSIFSKGTNVNYPTNVDSSRYSYYSDGEITGLSSEFILKAEFFTVLCKAGSKLFFNLNESNKLSLSQPYRIPKYTQTLLLNKDFPFGLSVCLNATYQLGVTAFNFSKNRVETLSNYMTADLLINQKIFDQNLFIAIRNLTNQYYELNYSVPEPGINFLLGLSLNF